MGSLDGKVAFISGVARGQGRSHAVTLARNGADIIGFDLCRKPDSTPYAGASEEDLQETIRLVKETGQQIVASVADVRDLAQVRAAFDSGIEQFGRVDIVLANAGIMTCAKSWLTTAEAWRETIDINLTGVWHTAKVAVPTLIEQGDGGAIVLTGSTEALKGSENISCYSAAKHGVHGLMTSMARELGEYNIRVNTVDPTCVDTPLFNNDAVYRMFGPDLTDPTHDDVVDRFADSHLLPIPYIQPQDVSNAVLYLVSDTGRYTTASAMRIDAGFIIKS